MQKLLSFTQLDFVRTFSGFEYAAKHAAVDQCWTELCACIDKFQELHNHGSDLSHFRVSSKQKLAIYTRFMAALAQWAARSDVSLSYQQFRALSHGKKLLVSIANASGYCGTSHYIDLLANTPPGANKSFSPEKLTLLFALVSLDDLPTQLLQLAIKQSATIFLPYLLGALSERFVLTEQGERNRTLLLQHSEKIIDAQIPPDEVNRLLNVMSSAWMYCSYAQYEHKHQLKKHLNKLIVKYAFDGKTQFMVKPPPKRKKPRILVIHERFTASHAMHRCWGSIIKGLSTHFELISLGFEGYVDDCTKSIFTESIVCSMKKPLPEIIKIIQDHAPDAIFYPSVGMQLQIIGLANLRLAPVQVAGTGHPASTMSEAMDFIVSGWKNLPVNKALYSENVICSVAGAKFAVHLKLPDPMPERKQRDSGAVIVGIHGKIMKINNGLMHVIDQLVARSSKQLRFRFYPGEYGSYYEGAKISISKRMAHAQIYPVMPYPDFIHHINGCDFFINPFPFGNTNSLIDCLLLHKPVIAMYGDEPHSQTDAKLLDMVGLRHLVASDEQSYVQLALRLIEDESFANEIVDHLRSINLHDIFYGNEEAIDRVVAAGIANAINGSLNLGCVPVEVA